MCRFAKPWPHNRAGDESLVGLRRNSADSRGCTGGQDGRQRLPIAAEVDLERHPCSTGRPVSRGPVLYCEQAAGRSLRPNSKQCPTSARRGGSGVKILGVQRSTDRDHVVLSARCKVRRIGLDDVIFRIPTGFQDFVCADASPFAAALLLPAMKQGEDLVIHGSISEALHSGMTQIVKVVSAWGIGLKAINIEADELVPDSPGSGVTATFFSAGVDSFYTYLRHRHDPGNAISQLLLVNGYDIAHDQPGLWDATLRNVSAMAAEEGVSLIHIESNVRPLIEPILPWSYSFGGCLAAATLCLRRGIAQIYVPSSVDATQLFPWGSHPDIDYLWGTEELKVVHDGGEALRIEKVTSQIAHSPAALKYLRVCYLNDDGAYNCGRCDKCLRTMLSLYVAGVLDKAETFPHEIDPGDVAAMAINGDHGAMYHRENLAALRSRGLAPDLQKALEDSMSRVPNDAATMSQKLYNRIAYFDHCYTRGILRYFVKRAGVTAPRSWSK